MGWIASASATTRLYKNIVTDFGAVSGNQAACDAAFFDNFAPWATSQTLPITLTIPPGNYPVSYAKRYWTGGGDDLRYTGIKDLTIEAAGATTTNWWIGGFGQIFDNQHHARINAVSAGSSTVTVNDGNIGRFAVGKWIAVAEIDTQGSGGPANPWVFEYAKISAINANTITLTSVLKHSYAVDRPYYSPGASFPELPGPATIIAIDERWNTRLTVNGLTVDMPADGVFGAGRDITLNNCTFLQFGPAPSQSVSFVMNNCTFSGAEIEVDKMVESVAFNNCTGKLYVQSASVVNMSVNGCTLDYINGTPKYLTLSNSTVGSLSFGPAGAYGVSLAATITNSAIGAISEFSSGELLSTFTNSAATSFAPSVSIADGKLRKALTDGPQEWMVPGAKFFLSNTDKERNFGSVTTISDISAITGQAVFQTDRTTAFPNADPTQDVGVHAFRPVPILSVTASGNTGCEEIVSMNGTTGPIYQRLTRSLTSATVGDTSVKKLWGKLVEVRINVTRAYTGAQSTATMNVNGQFGSSALAANQTDRQAWNPVVNLKVTGERVITPIAVTGAQSGDTLGSAPGQIWFGAGDIWQRFSANTVGDTAGQQALVTITYVTDQGVA